MIAQPPIREAPSPRRGVRVFVIESDQGPYALFANDPSREKRRAVKGLLTKLSRRIRSGKGTNREAKYAGEFNRLAFKAVLGQCLGVAPMDQVRFLAGEVAPREIPEGLAKPAAAGMTEQVAGFLLAAFGFAPDSM